MNRVAFSIFGVEIYWYAIFITLGMICGALSATYVFKKRGYKAFDLMIDCMIAVIPSAIIGARLYYYLFSGEHWTIAQFFDFRSGGLAVYGGIIASAIALLVVAKIKKINIIDIFDGGGLGLLIGQAIGRWGNFVNQEAFGNLVIDPAKQWFPLAVKIPYENYSTVPDALAEVLKYYQTPPQYCYFMATFFYESMLCLLCFIALFIIAKKINIKGVLYSSYFVAYGIIRLIVEGFRTDSLKIGESAFRVSQLLSLVLIFVGIGLLVFYIVRYKKYNGNVPLKKAEDDNSGDTIEEGFTE